MTKTIAIKLLLICMLFMLAPLSTAASKKDQKERAEQLEMILKSSPIYQAPALQDYVSRIGQKLAQHSSSKKEFKFYVVDNQMVNAFALEHGDIFITRGMLSYLQNEAQLAAVLGHEIGHVSERHHSRQKGAGGSAKALSTIAALLVYYHTGSASSAGSIKNTGDLMAAEAITSYGRDKELESDAVGAELMGKAGYDVQALLDVMAILKDQERFSKVKQKRTGAKASGYHGLFASHPRNDKRLLNIIQVAGVDNAKGRSDKDDPNFRMLTNGLRFNDRNLQSAVVENMYYNRNLNFAAAFPEGWKVIAKGSVIQAKAGKDGAIMQLKAKKADPELSPQEYLEKNYNISTMVNTEVIHKKSEGINGFTALVPGGQTKPSVRWGVIYYMGAAYVFTAQTENKALESMYDTMFVSSIKNFRPLSREDLTIAAANSIRYIQAPEGLTYAALAKESPLKNYAEEELRLINGDYPRGEPETGEWIKIIQ